MKATPCEINNVLDDILGLSKFHSDVHLFLLGFVEVKYMGRMFVQIRKNREIAIGKPLTYPGLI